VNLNNKRQKLVRKLTNKEYRDAWVDESVKTVVPFQIQAMRNQRSWSQEMLGEKAGMLRNAVSRVESVDYGNLSLNTLLRIAHGFDCGLLVKFVPFSRMAREFESVSPSALEVNEFGKDINNLHSWVSETEQIDNQQTRQLETFATDKTGGDSLYEEKAGDFREATYSNEKVNEIKIQIEMKDLVLPLQDLTSNLALN